MIKKLARGILRFVIVLFLIFGKEMKKKITAGISRFFSVLF